MAIDSDAAVATLAPGPMVIVIMNDGVAQDGPLENLARGHEAERGRNVQLTAELEAAKAKSHDLARALEAERARNLELTAALAAAQLSPRQAWSSLR